MYISFKFIVLIININETMFYNWNNNKMCVIMWFVFIILCNNNEMKWMIIIIILSYQWKKYNTADNTSDLGSIYNFLYEFQRIII